MAIKKIGGAAHLEELKKEIEAPRLLWEFPTPPKFGAPAGAAPQAANLRGGGVWESPRGAATAPASAPGAVLRRVPPAGAAPRGDGVHAGGVLVRPAIRRAARKDPERRAPVGHCFADG